MNNQKVLFWASFFTLIAAGMGFAIRGGGILAEWGSAFSFTKTDLGEITGMGLFGFGITIIGCSVFIDRIGYKPLMIAAFLLHVASAVVTLAATPVYDGFGAGEENKEAAKICLSLGLFLFALANGVCEAVINPLVATIFPKQKTHYLNILHAGWPGGLILGGILAYFFVGRDAMITQLRWEIPIAFFLLPTLLYGFMILKEKFPVSEARAAGVGFSTMLKEFASPMLLFLFVLHAMVGYVELGTDSWITDIMQNLISGEAVLLFIYTSAIMFVLRFFAGPIVEHINPVGLLLVSAVLGCLGLYLLGTFQSAVLLIVAATIYGLGKTFLWPTMLGVVGERFPKGGALTMGTIGGIGMMSAGLLGGPAIGYQQDVHATEYLEENAEATYERYVSKAPYSKKLDKWVDESKKVDNQWPAEFGEVVMKEKPNSFLGFTSVGLDGKKVGDLKDKIKNIQRKKKNGEPISESEELTETEKKDIEPVLQAGIYGGQQALKLTAIVPGMMAIGYLILVLYFRSKGGYQVEVLHGEEPVGEHYTGGVEGPVE